MDKISMKTQNYKQKCWKNLSEIVTFPPCHLPSDLILISLYPITSKHCSLTHWNDAIGTQSLSILTLS